MVGDDVDDAAPQHWRMRQQDELYLMKRILVAWMISVLLQWDELYLMKRGLDDADFLLGLKVDPVPSDPVGAKNRQDDEVGRNTSRGFTPRWSHKKTPF